ncbi:hypothetical protein MKX03_024351 [Papaver bracteatum]|nr:hypothetical protein MKX03_024351 [Papaver bracteatum]
METVVIEEFDPLAFKAMLLFLYSDEFPETHELSDSNSLCISITLVQHLLAAADRFDVSRLKLMCEAKLCEEITANTVADTLALAELQQCLQLKDVCLNFAAKPRNLGEVMKTDGYSYVEKWCPSLLTDLLKKCMRPRVSKSQLFYETVQDSHEFEINGYSLIKGIGVGKYKSSGKFTVGGYDWKIRFSPDGDHQACKEYISVFIELASPGEVSASIEIKLLDQRREGQFSSCCKSSHTFKAGSSTWGFAKYMKRSEFETSNYLKDERLSIHGTVSIVQTRFQEDKRYVIPVPPSDMIQNLKGLLKSEIGSDITFQVADEEFRAHKSILAARSPVFKAMFFGLVGNPDMQTVDIKEFDPFTFKAMLLFLYSDELPETHELSDTDSPCTSTIIMPHLLAAADRYNLARLRLMCEEKLYEDISAETVADTLALAELHQCLELKTACLNFAAKRENLGGNCCFLNSDKIVSYLYRFHEEYKCVHSVSG